MQRCREQRKGGGEMQRQRAKEGRGGDAETESKGREGGGAAECRFRVRKLSIYTCFIFKWWLG
jgi:hypothetical protein